MSTITVTTKTSEQIAADFEAVFKAVQPPASVKPLTQEDRLAPYRKEIKKQRRRGLTWQQIAVGMSDPRINEKVSASTLRRLFAPVPKYRSKITRLILNRPLSNPAPTSRPPAA